MNFKFKKPPFYFYIILWIISLALGLQLDKKIQNLSDLFGLVVLIMPIAFAYIWVLKNKIKIFNYYKKIRKKFRHVFYTIEGLVCVFIFSVIVSLISFGSYKNLKEKVLLEIIIWNDKFGQLCTTPAMYTGYGEYSKFFFKAETQYLDYFQFKPYSFVKEVYQLKNDTLFNFDRCIASRILLKEAHKGNQIAKDILGAYPITEYSNYFSINDKYIFQRYSDSLNKEKLYNPALVHAAGYNSLDRLRYFKQAAEEGYLLGMQDYLWEFSNEKFDIKIHRDECPLILKYVTHLKNENSLIESANIMWSLMGKKSYLSRAIYECSDKKTDFRKAILFMENFQSKVKNPKDTSNFVTTYPAMIYFNGWGNVDKNKDLAVSLFKKNVESKEDSNLSKAYLTFNNLNNYKNDLKLLNEILVSEVTIYKSKRYIVCNNVKYDFKIPKVDKENKQQKQSRKLKYLEPLKTCLDNATKEQRIISVKSYIKSWIEDWFKNPELVKTLNLYG